MTSLRRQLLVWLLSGLLLAGLAAAAATYFKAWEEVSELLDDQLQQVGFSLQHPSAFPMGVPDDDQGEEEESEEHLTVQIWDQNGVLRYRSRHHPLPPRQSQAGFHTLLWNHRLWRIFVIIHPHRTIQVSQSLDARLKMATGFAVRVIIPIAGLIPLLALLIWIVVGRALRPLNDITAALGKRSAGALAPMPEIRLPDEIGPLINALNSLLARLEQAFAQQRKFVADAAHELRTPLTAVQLQAQVVERTASEPERAEALGQLKAGIQRATHLTQQLLTLARLEPEASAQPFQAVDLEALVKSTLAEFAPLAQERRIDLGLTRCEAATVTGDADSLRILLGNLIDNAIRYTPARGKVDVALYTQNDEIIVRVEDSGPGIPLDERSRVLDRFYRRMENTSPGSGLGLAIAKSVADLHHGVLALNDGAILGGLRVELRLRREITGHTA